jgi:hypothetical protein
MDWFLTFNRWFLLNLCGSSFDISVLEDPEHYSVPSLVILGIRAASEGRTEEAFRFLAAISERPVPNQNRHGSDIKILRACIEKSSGNPEGGLEILSRHARGGNLPFVVGRLAIRWMVAECLEELNRPVEAAEAYELVISPLNLSSSRDLYVRIAYISLAHRKLAILYSRLGNTESARDHLEAFEALFTDPAPETRPLLETVRSAVAGK